MKQNLYMLLRLLVVFATPVSMLAQQSKERILTQKEISELIATMNNSYASENLRLEYELKSYAGHHSKVIEDSEHGTMIRKGNHVKCTFMGLTSICDGINTVTIHTKEKIVVLSSEPEMNSNEEMYKSWLQVLTDRCEITLTESENKKELAIIYPPGALIERSIVITDSLFRPKSAVIYYSNYIIRDPGDPKSIKEKPRVEINFQMFEMSAEIDDSQFDLKQYVQITRDKCTLKKEYSGYRLFDTRYKPNNRRS